jgi:hypothetical protein
VNLNHIRLELLLQGMKSGGETAAARGFGVQNKEVSSKAFPRSFYSSRSSLYSFLGMICAFSDFWPNLWCWAGFCADFTADSLEAVRHHSRMGEGAGNEGTFTVIHHPNVASCHRGRAVQILQIYDLHPVRLHSHATVGSQDPFGSEWRSRIIGIGGARRPSTPPNPTHSSPALQDTNDLNQSWYKPRTEKYSNRLCMLDCNPAKLVLMSFHSSRIIGVKAASRQLVCDT